MARIPRSCQRGSVSIGTWHTAVVVIRSKHTIAGPVAHVTATVCVPGCTASSRSGSLAPPNHGESKKRVLRTNGTLVSVRRMECSGEGNLTLSHLHWRGWAGRWLGQASEKGTCLPLPPPPSPGGNRFIRFFADNAGYTGERKMKGKLAKLK